MTRRGLRRLALLICIALLLAAALVAGTAWRSQVRAQELQALRSTGLALYEQGEHEAALKELSRYVRAVKDDYAALLAYAECQYATPQPNSRHIQLAIAAARLATEVEPSSVEGHELLMRLYARAGFRTELADTCSRILGIDAYNRDAYEFRINALLQLGDHDGASKASLEYIEHFPEDLRAHIAHVRALGGTEAADQILDYLRSNTVAGLFSDRPMYHLLVSRAEAARVTGQQSADDRASVIRSAIRSAKRAAELEPIDHAEALGVTRWLRELSVLSGDPDLADLSERATDRYLKSEIFGSAHATASSLDAWWRLDDARAVELAEHINPESTEPNHAGWRLFLMHALTRSGLDCTGCEQALESDESPQAQDWLNLTESLRLIDKMQSLREVLAHTGKVSSPEAYPIARFLEGEAYRRHGMLDSAVTSFRDAAGADRALPTRPRAVLALADALSARGDTTQADRLFAELMRVEISGPVADMVASRRLERELNTHTPVSASAAADNLLDRVLPELESRLDDPDTAAEHARLLLLAGREAEGVVASKRLLDLGPVRNPLRITSLAEVLAAHDPVIAEDLLDRQQASGFGAIEIVNARAELAARKTNAADGLVYFESLIGSDGIDSRWLARQRAAYMDRHDLPGAIEALAGLSAEYPASGAVQFDVLASKAAWEDERLIRQAVARLRASSAEDSLEWQLAKARADLRFLPSHAGKNRNSELARIAQSLNNLRRVDANNGELLMLLAEAYAGLGDMNRAADLLAEAASKGQRAEAYPTLVRLLLGAGKRQEAVKAMGRFAGLRDLPVAMMRERAGLLEAFRLYPEAVEDRRYLAALGDPWDIASYGRLLARLGRGSDAGRAAELLLTGRPPIERVRSAAAILLAAGFYDRAEAALRDALAVEGLSGLLDAELGTLLLESGSWDRAADHLLRAYSDVPSDDVALKVAHALLETNRVEQLGEFLGRHESDDNAGAVHTLSSVVSAGNVQALDARRLILAKILVAGTLSDDPPGRGLADAADAFLRGEADDDVFLERLGSLCDTFPHDENVWKSLAGYALASNQSEKSVLAILEGASSALPNRAWPERELALVHLGAGRFDAARDAVRRMAERLGTDTFESDMVRARIEASAGDMSSAFNWVSRHQDRLESGGGRSPGLSILVSGLAGRGDADQAERIIEKKLGENSEWASLYLDSVASLPATETDTARRWLIRVEETIVQDEHLVKRILAWFRLARFSDNLRDAERAFDLIQRIPPEQTPSGIELVAASLEAQLGRPDEASRRLEAIIDKEPRNAYALNNHANILARRLGDTERALEQATKAVSLAESGVAPSDPLGSFYHTLAVIHRLRSELAPAEEALRRGIELAGATPELSIELAELMLDLGREADAEKAIRSMSRRQDLPPKLLRRLREINFQLDLSSTAD